MAVGKIVQTILVARVIAKNIEFQDEINETIRKLQAQGYMLNVQYAANDTIYSALIVAREYKDGVNSALPEGAKFMLEVVNM